MSDTPSWMPADDPAVTLGTGIRVQFMGANHVDQALAAAENDPLMQMLQSCVTRLAWAGVWGRPGLDLKYRSLITLSVLLAQGHEHEFELHLRGALKNGWSKEELAEAIIHIGCYAGWPVAMRGFRIARQVFDSPAAE
jgi:4-carboxymuconolactone decarboxylase